MSFRDDHDAALARAAALQAELDRARADDDRQESRIAQLEAQLAQTEAQRQAAEAELARLRPPPPTMPVVHEWGTIVRVLVVVGLMLFGILVVVGTRCDSDRPVGALESEPAIPTWSSDEIWPWMTSELRERARGRLFLLSLRGVTSKGTLDPSNGTLEATFLEHDRCTFHVRDVSGWKPSSTGYDCALAERNRHHPDVRPRCSAKAIWELAISRGVPSNELANLHLLEEGWRFVIPNRFEMTFPDHCKAP